RLPPQRPRNHTLPPYPTLFRSSGLEGLATDYGITVDEPQQAAPAAPPAAPPTPPAQPAAARPVTPPPAAPPAPPAPAAAPVRLSQVTLTQAASTVSLSKPVGTSSAPHMNSQWVDAHTILDRCDHHTLP